MSGSSVPPRLRPWRVALLAVLFALTCATLSAPADDAVIMPDGLVIHGRWFKEHTLVSDPALGAVSVAKQNGFDVIEDGPKYITFSRHSQKGAKLEQDLSRPNVTAYTVKAYRTGTSPLPTVDGAPQMMPFKEKWERTIYVKVAPSPKVPGGGKETILQQVASLDPYTMTLNSMTHVWRSGYHTNEQSPEMVLKLLRMHPDLKDPEKGPPDPQRRLAIAEFMKDAGWLKEARDEQAKLKRDLPEPWPQPVTARFDKLTADTELAETRLVLDILEAAVGAGQYNMARQVLVAFKPYEKDPKENNRLGAIKAQIEIVQPRYELTTRLLRTILERESGQSRAEAFIAAAGGPVITFVPQTKPPVELATLLVAGWAVLAELHQDTAGRLELFTGSAEEAEKRRRDGKEPGESPAQLLAMAVSGWLKGKNGANTDVPAAVRCWQTRELATAYVQVDIGNNRRALLNAYQKSGKPLSPDELAQIVTLLPPPMPEDLANPGGKKIAKDDAGRDNVYRRKADPTPDLPQGTDYFLHLPPEYHHGRSYPVIVALSTPQLPAEKLVGFLAPYADRYGYVVAAPDWSNQFGPQQYDFSGKEHPLVTATIRDLFRRFQVDADRVFLYGFQEGANFALDLAMSRPDLFAGLVAVGANPPPTIYREFFKNAQKLPVYMVTGELAGSFPNHRILFEKWMANGYPALLTLYKGRGPELYPMEFPRMFDWMNRKTRVRGAAVLRLNQTLVEPWQILREADNRYYWVGIGPNGLVNPNNRLGNPPGAKAANPAQFRADIGRGGVVRIDLARGIKKFVIWLERDLIDWTKPLRVEINGNPARNYKPKVMEPDLHVMFEELFRSGDRKMLFLGKVEIEGPG